MARKTSSQTIEKIEEQIDHLKEETSVDDITPILDSEVLKKNQEATSSPKKKTTTKRASTAKKTSTTKKTSTAKKTTSSSTTKKTTSSTTRKKTNTRDEVVVSPEKKTTTKKTTSKKNVRDDVVVSEKITRPRKTKKVSSKELEESIKAKNDALQENVEKIVEAIKEDNLDQEIANISLEEFETDGKELHVELDDLEKEIEAIVQGEKEEKEKEIEEDIHQEILEDSTFIDDSKKIILDDELDFPFDFEKEKEEETIPEATSLEDTIEILHSGETTKLDDTIKRIHEEEDTIELLHSGDTKELEDVVKITHYDDIENVDLDHIDQLDDYDLVSEFEKDLNSGTRKKKSKISKDDSFDDNYQDLENDLRSLYDKVNDVVDDINPDDEKDTIDFIELKNRTETKAPVKKTFSFKTLKKNLSLKIDALRKSLFKKKVQKTSGPLEEKYKPKKVRKKFKKLSQPQPVKRKKVRVDEVEEYAHASILDYISQKVLNIIMIFLSIIFVLMCIAFVVFVVYVSTF